MKTTRFGYQRKSTTAMLKEKLIIMGGFVFLFAVLAVIVVVVGAKLPNPPHDSLTPSQGNAANQLATASAQPVNQVVLIVPKAPIAQGVKLEADLFREVYWERDRVPEGSVRDSVSIEGLYARVALPASLPVVSSNLQNNPPVFGIENLLPEGYRAISIDVNATTGVEGWATPGAKVDVLVTYRDQKEGEYKTKVAVENATVISYNGSARIRTGASTELNNVSTISDKGTVTLAVPFEASLKIPTAKAIGTLSLILRNSGDIKHMGTTSFGETDFDEPRGVIENQPKNRGFSSIDMPGGRVRVSGADGQAREFVLEDGIWYQNDDE